MSKIKVLVVEPNRNPYVKEIRPTLKEEQKIVGGLIEPVDLDENGEVVLICNEKGKANRMQPNRYVPQIEDTVFGTFFLCGGEGEDFSSLSGQQIFYFRNYFAVGNPLDIGKGRSSCR